MEQYITLVWHSPVKMSVPTTGKIYNKILSQAQLYMYDVKMWEHCNFMPSKLPQFFFFNFHCYQGIHSGDMIRTLLQCSFHTVQMAYEQKKNVMSMYKQSVCWCVGTHNVLTYFTWLFSVAHTWMNTTYLWVVY